MNNVILVLVGFLVVYGIYWKIKHTYHDITVPDSGIRRTDLYYGYYSCLEEQVAETKDHINLFMDSQFNGQEKTIQNILDAKMDTCLDVAYQITEKKPGASLLTMHPDAEQRLTDFLTLLEERGALQYIKIFYPSDEPNNVIGNEQVVADLCAVVRKVSLKFPVLKDVKLAVIYASDKAFIGYQHYDYVGFDAYDQKSGILEIQYQQLKHSLLPGQKTILVPGGAYGQDPTPFVNFAESNPEVGIVMPFLWFQPGPEAGAGIVGIGKRPGLREQYVSAGKLITNK